MIKLTFKTGIPSWAAPQNDDLATLRKYGIRTGTDLIRAHTEAGKRAYAQAGHSGCSAMRRACKVSTGSTAS